MDANPLILINRNHDARHVRALGLVMDILRVDGSTGHEHVHRASRMSSVVVGRVPWSHGRLVHRAGSGPVWCGSHLGTRAGLSHPCHFASEGSSAVIQGAFGEVLDWLSSLAGLLK